MSSRSLKNKTSCKVSGEGIALPITAQVFETMKSQDLSDPVAKQYLPAPEENIINLKENSDPIGDHTHSPIKGLVHRHPDRALLKITDSCSVYCRFCFRKEMVGKGQGTLKDHEIENILSYIQNNPQIREVILSGGDPLTLSNRRISSLLGKLELIEHLDVIRFHTRAPMVTPDRIDQEFLNIINNYSKAIYIVIHVNHAQEINQKIIPVFKQLSRTRATILSQTVLLKGINDSVNVLENLFRILVKNAVKPYYLHHPDLAQGTGHFRISIAEGQALMKALNGRISGLCLPNYVLDMPGGFGKIPINYSSIKLLEKDKYLIEDIHGQQHIYDDRQVKND